MSDFAATRQALLRDALAYPGAHEDHPWGEVVVKVRGKIFVFLGGVAAGPDGPTLTVTTKLPRTGGVALSLPFATPCGYGLGRSGWVTARWRAGEDVPVDLLRAWIEESYEAVAPRRLAASRGAPASPGPLGAATRKAAGAKQPAPAKKPASAKKPAGAKKPAAVKKPAAARRSAR